MVKNIIVIGIAVGLLLVCYHFTSSFYLLSLNYWELVLIGSLILSALAGGAYVWFNQKPTVPIKPTLNEPKGASEIPDISPREKEVLEQLCLGKSNKQIATALFISESTVKTHVSNLLVKFNMTSRAQIMHKMQHN